MTIEEPTRGANLRLNAICPYFTMFPLSFPHRHLSAAKPGEWVLDPFCGRGTTNFAARLNGVPSVGVDANPVAVAIAQAKLSSATADEVVSEAETLLLGPPPTNLPIGSFWDLAYHPRTLEAICQIREGLLRSCDSAARITLRAIILGILHGPRNKGVPSYLSNQMPRTYATKPEPARRYWTRHNLRAAEIDVLDLIVRRTRHTLAQLPPHTTGYVARADSREPISIPSVPGGYGWVITSPPYFGMRSYQSDQWLRLWFLGGDSTIRYGRESQVRHRSGEYAEDLVRVWRNVAARCRPGARLVVRYGSIPTSPCNAKAMLMDTLACSGAPWRVVEIQGAGVPSRSRRQAEQFERTHPPEEEIDLVAVLEG